MDPRDLRNLTWAEVQTHLGEDLKRVHAAWLAHGPGTTRAVAERAGISLLTLRPRTTDLRGFGLVECIGQSGTEGVYAAVTAEVAERAWTERVRASVADPAATAQDLERQINTLPIKDQVALAASIMARAGHQRRQAARDARQPELTFA